MTCEKCGAELRIGSFPFCKGGHGPWNVSVIDDQLEGGARWCETMGHDPVWLDGTKSQWKREMDKRNLENVSRHDRAYHRRMFRQHDERLRDEKRV